MGAWIVRGSLVALACLCAGCGKGGEGGLLPVTGVVKNADGSPLKFESGNVLFQSTTGAKSATGAVQPDGTFIMMTQQPGDGVESGSYKVLLQLWENYRSGKSAVPEKYGDAATTPLEATVDSDHTKFEFTVEK
jgi:hypothetical protein